MKDMVIGQMDPNLSEKQADQMLASARLAAPTSCPVFARLHHLNTDFFYFYEKKRDYDQN